MYSLEDITDSLGVELDEKQKKAIKLMLAMVSQNERRYTSDFKYTLHYVDIVEELCKTVGLL